MPAPSDNKEFLELIRKSLVLDEKRLDAYIQQLRATSAVPPDPGKMAGAMVRDGLLTHFQAEQFLLGRWRRFTIGKYKVLERLGSGGMGSVYLCEHKFMRRRVAVKVLPAAKAEDQASLDRFYREARAVAALDHPNIVRAYDIDQDDKLHFLVMEYVDGASLQDVVKKHGPMEVLRAAHYLRQSAIGLQHAHEAGLIHRDIKPGNLLIDRTGTVKILDMGLARFFNDESDNLTKKHDENVLGTADYLAPEQALDSHGVDIRADIYSMGATYYFVLTGCTPFNEGTVAQKLIWHQTRQPKSIRAIRAEVPQGLVAIIEKMMAKDPAQRYQMPGEVIEALTSWTQTPIPPPPEKEMPRLCPAALGSNPSEASLAQHGSQTSAATKTAPAKTGPAPALRPTAPPNTRPSAAPAPHRVPAAATTAATPLRVPTNNHKVAPAPEPVQEDSNPPWEELSKDTDDPSAKADTPSSSKRSAAASKSKSRIARFTRSEFLNRRVVIVVAAVGALFALTLGAALWLWSSRGQKNDGKIESASTTYTVKPGTTLASLLTSAKPGDRIVVDQDVLEEQLLCVDGRRGKGVTIEAAAGKNVIWRFPTRLKKDEPFVQLSVEGLRLKGFTFDGAGKAKDLFLLFGRCSGLVLEDLQIEGFYHYAINVANCEGEAGKPIQFLRVRTVSSAEPPDAALNFFAGKNNTISANNFVVARECRFEGPYKSAAIQFEGGSVGIELHRNRLFKVGAGIRYKTAPAPYPLGLIIANNTFYEVPVGLHLEALPPGDSGSQITIQNNLFVSAIKALALVDGNLDANQLLKVVPSPEGNARDNTSKEGNLTLAAKEVSIMPPLSVDPRNDKTFLRYGAGNSIMQAGTPGVPPE